LRFALVDFYASRKRPEDARRTLLDIVSLGKDAPAGLTARGQLAALSLAAGDPGQARATLADVLKVNPRDRAALVLRGRIRLADGDAAGAIIDLRAAAKDQPGSAEIAALLAQAHRACGQPQLAREVLADAARFKPEDPALHLLLAQDSMLTKDSAAALLEIDQAARLAPKDARPAAMRIDLARALGDSAAVEKAMLAFETQFPNNAAGFLELGRLYESQRRFDAARAQFDIAARLAPNSAETAAAVVGLLVGQRRYADAEARAKAIIAAQPKSAFGHELWAEVALAKGDLDGAEHAFRDVIALVPKAPGAYRNLAQLKLRRHDLAGALAVLDAGKQANPDDLSLDLARAQALAGAGQVDDGIAVYEALLKRAPNNDLAANNLADLLAQAKRDPASLNRALEVARHFEASPVPVYVDTLGMVHYRLGQFDQAARLFAHAVALAPNEPALQLHYGMALYKTGAQQRGRDLLRKAIDSRRPLPDLTEAKALVAQS
jgi:predicted Zn-dependent protease